jgi:hypothetical protein
MTETAPHCCPIPAGISLTRKQKMLSTKYVWSTRGPRHGVPLSRRPAGALLAAGAVLLALAACQSEPAKPQAAAEPAAESPAPAQTAAGQPVVEERLSTADCATPAQGRVHFNINDVVFAVPGNDVRTVVPPDVTPSTPADQVVAMLREQTAEGAGCPEKPLEAGLLGVAGPAGDPLVADTIALFRSPAGAIATPFGTLTREMLANSDRCQTGQGGLIACQALQQNGAQQMQSLYLLSTERNRTLAFGGPLAARCVVANGQVRGCEIVDELPGGIGLRAPLKALPQSSAALAAAHQAALAKVRSLRL